jgi:hypothetical protein
MTGEPAGTGIGAEAGVGVVLIVGTRLEAGAGAAADGGEAEASCVGTAAEFGQDRKVLSAAAGDEADADLQASMSKSGEADEIKQVLYDKRIHPFIGK